MTHVTCRLNAVNLYQLSAIEYGLPFLQKIVDNAEEPTPTY